MLIQLGEHLANIALNQVDNINIRPSTKGIKLGKALSRTAVTSDMQICHLRLGVGTVTEVDTQSLLSQDKKATILRINFDIGQSCKFVFRSDAASKTLFSVQNQF